jgi:hypothetical protein
MGACFGKPKIYEELDRREAYYIGKYNAYERGGNKTRGNNRREYERGYRSRYNR